MTDIMEARRKGFERWINNQAFNPKLDVISAWQGYNAALDSVCVEFPRVPNFDISAEESLEMDPDDYEALEAQHSYMVDVHRECRSAIERAGLKVKP